MTSSRPAVPSRAVMATALPMPVPIVIVPSLCTFAEPAASTPRIATRLLCTSVAPCPAAYWPVRPMYIAPLLVKVALSTACTP
ncbi:hypothetical protein D3C71_1639010 [compost metagenome]